MQKTDYNLQYYGELQKFYTNISQAFNGEYISDLNPVEGEGEDFSGCAVLPGFIDVHIHGCNMADTTDGNSDSVAKMSKWLAQNGITSFCPTKMTLPADIL